MVGSLNFIPNRLNMKPKFKNFLTGIILCLMFNLPLIALPLGKEANEQFLDLMNCQLPSIINECPGMKDHFLGVKPLEDGGPSFINSVYLIELKNGDELIIKIGNPIWKDSKTLNEISALKFLKIHSEIPVPYVLAYNNNVDHSPIGKEYIIMPRMPGRPLNYEIEKLYKDKISYYKILDQLALIIAQLKSYQFSTIGNFKEYKNGDRFLEIGGIVDFANYEISEPCTTYSQYGRHALNFYIKEMGVLLDKNSQDRELYQKYIPILKDLLATNDFNLLNGSDKFVFSHQDFVMKNILVDGDTVTAVLDWEWSGSALMEIESMTGFDFLLTDEDRSYFSNALKNLGISDFFDPPPMSESSSINCWVMFIPW